MKKIMIIGFFIILSTSAFSEDNKVNPLGTKISPDTISLGADHLITTGTITAAEIRVTGDGVSEVNELRVTGSLTIPYGSNEMVLNNGEIAIDDGITDLGPTIVYFGNEKKYVLAVEESEFVAIEGYTFAYNADKDSFVMQEAALKRWDYFKPDLSPANAKDNIILGHSNAATANTILYSSGQVTFNEQGEDVDFRVESDASDALFFVDGSGAGKVGIGTSQPTEALTVSGTLLVEGDKTSHIDFGAVTADPCQKNGSREVGEGGQFYNDISDYFCFCNGDGDAVQLHSPTTACF